MSGGANGASNWSVKEEIRNYWSARAATFDDSPGHRIDDAVEAPEWKALFAEALGDLNGRRVLDVACGTGEISRMLLDLGASVHGVDFAEPMLARARAKLEGRDWTGSLSDAELLPMEPDAGFDAVVTRHLVWTLVEPASAFAAWRRVLRPGGRLLVIDGDWSKPSLRSRLLRALAARLAPDDSHARGVDRGRHEEILKQVHYATGLSAAALRGDLADAGFDGFRRHDVRAVYRRGMRHAALAARLRLMATDRFAISAARPAEPAPG